MVPTKERNPSSVFVSYKNHGILFDCAEGTQRQMNLAGISRTKVQTILISHWHGDHVAGIIGLLQTIGNSLERPSLVIYGPKGTKEHMKHVLKSCDFDFAARLDVKVYELIPKKVEMFFEGEEYSLYCCPLEHSIPCLGYSFVEKERRNVDVSFMKKHKIRPGPYLEHLKAGKDIVYNDKKIKSKEATYIVPGKKVAYVIDTAYTTQAIKLAKDADVLICEATYHSALQEKAELHGHLTSKEAAQIASQANVKQLVITHFSQRYDEVSELLAEARDVFPNTKDAFDLMKIML